MYGKEGGREGEEPRGGGGTDVSTCAAAPEACSAGGGCCPWEGRAASAPAASPTCEASARATRQLMLRVCTFGRATGLSGGEGPESLLSALSLLVLLGLSGGLVRDDSDGREG